MEQMALSRTMISNLFTMGATAKVDPRQTIPEPYTMPTEEVRLLRARLLFEETMETIKGLGFCPAIVGVCNDYHPIEGADSVQWQLTEVNEKPLLPNDPPNMEQIIDGCCDTIYVAVGTLAACGIPDNPHLEVVCTANEAKFPEGVATANEHGKFQKPAGWQPPDHAHVQQVCDKVVLKNMVPTNWECNVPNPLVTQWRSPRHTPPAKVAFFDKEAEAINGAFKGTGWYAFFETANGSKVVHGPYPTQIKAYDALV